jgi:hypothetical protein
MEWWSDGVMGIELSEPWEIGTPGKKESKSLPGLKISGSSGNLLTY